MCFDSAPQTTTVQQQSNIPAWAQTAAQNNYNKGVQIANRPFPTFQGPRIADFNSDQNAGFGMIRDSVEAWKPANEQAMGMASAAGQGWNGTFAPTMPEVNSGPKTNLGGGATSQGGMVTGVNQVTPGKFTDANVNQYMNPYMDAVTGELRRQGEIERAQLGNRAAASNAFGGSRAGILEGMQREGEARNVGLARAQAFENAQGQINADQNRGLQGQLANQNALNTTNLTNTGRVFDRNTQVGNQGFAAQQLQANQFNQDQSRRLQSADLMNNLGLSRSQSSMNDALSLLASGSQQQGQTQKNFDLAVNDFEREFNYPTQNLNLLMSSLANTPLPRDQTSTSVGPGGSPFGQALGGAATIAGLGGQNGLGWWGRGSTGGPFGAW